MKQEVRIHSCERGTTCGKLAQSDVVYIIPMISRTSRGEIMPELGAGGGANDLLQCGEIQLNGEMIAALKRLCSQKLIGQELRTKILGLVSHAELKGNQAISLETLQVDRDVISLDEFLMQCKQLIDVGGGSSAKQQITTATRAQDTKRISIDGQTLPKTIVSVSDLNKISVSY